MFVNLLQGFYKCQEENILDHSPPFKERTTKKGSNMQETPTQKTKDKTFKANEKQMRYMDPRYLCTKTSEIPLIQISYSFYMEKLKK